MLLPRIIIIHYHLNPGGVTRIIESQVQALLSLKLTQEIVVFTGACENPSFFKKLGVELIIEPILNYLAEDSNWSGEYTSLKKAFLSLIKPGDILHVHNLNLGKNPLLTLVVSEIAKDGIPIVNHAHDFAEDRPDNFHFLESVIGEFYKEKLSDILYPNHSGFAHAALNTPDLLRLREYGISEQNSVLLANPVVFSDTDEEFDAVEHRKNICITLKIPEHKKIITYPVRVIRRKNIGEFILFALLFSEEANWLVTQPPKNPVELKFYEQWKVFCVEENIPLVFEAGTQVGFEELIRTSDLCFTTSIKEGFGMVYMEPWLMCTPVGGRSLMNITPDLEQSGMQFPLLYDKLNVLIQDEVKDFGFLSMEKQMGYIRQVKSDPNYKKEFIERNPFANNLLNSIDQSIINKNKNTILQEYSLEKYAGRLENLYKKLT